VGHLRTGLQQQQLHLKMIELAGAGRCVIVFGRIGFEELDELVEGRHRHLAGIDQQQMRLRRDDADWRQVTLDVVGHLANMRDDAERSDRGDQQRVAVGRRLRRGRRADEARAAGDIVQDERLAEALRERLAQQARHGIRDAACRRRHDDPHRPRRPAG
jgi:hypothetical protein